jgi:phosphotransferase system enzyme I (PtsP)
VFRATEGLNPGLVGKVSLAPGEGLVGLVAEREEPVNLEDAELHPNFRLLPNIGEESFHAFLGVPIIHQREVLGVLVVQQARRRRFDESEEAFLVTMSAQLAGVIAHAMVTGEVPDESSPERDTRLLGAISGVPGAPGWVSAPRWWCRRWRTCTPYRGSRAETAAGGAARVQARPVPGARDIESVAANLRDKLSPEDLALFDVYLGILDDSTIGGEVAALIKSGQWAQGALAQVMVEHIRHFEAMEHSYLRERAVDVKDLGERVLGYLQAEQREDQDFTRADDPGQRGADRIHARRDSPGAPCGAGLGARLGQLARGDSGPRHGRAHGDGGRRSALHAPARHVAGGGWLQRQRASQSDAGLIAASASGKSPIRTLRSTGTSRPCASCPA